MRRGSHVIFLVLIILVLIFSSCSRQIEISSDESTTSSVPTNSDAQDQPVDSPKAAQESEQPTPTPEAGLENPNIHPVQMNETGMVPIPISSLNGVAVHPRIIEIMTSWDWNSDDFTKGIDQYNNALVVHNRFSEPIAGKIVMGTGFSVVESVLGAAGYKEENLLVYRTTDFYMAFYGAGKADFVAFMHSPGKDYDVNFLYKLIEELNSDGFTSLEASIEKLDPDLDFFTEKGSNDGISYYANSLYGIIVSDVEEPIIDVMNNYEGNLYIQDSGDIRFSQAFINIDVVVIQMRDILNRLDNISKTFEQNGVLSPDGKLKAVYYPDECIMVRTLDSSIEDRIISGFTTGEFYWLDSRYILYMDDFENKPKVVDLDDSMLWGESLIDQTEIKDSGAGFKIIKVENRVITLEDLSNNDTTNILYGFDGAGKIIFSME